MTWVQHGSGRGKWIVAALAVAAICVAAWWLAAPPAAPVASRGPANPAAVEPRVESALDTAPPAAGPAPAPVARATRPDTPTASEGMTAEQAKALREALKDHPNRDAEIARVTQYMGYLSRLERYRALLVGGRDEQARARVLAQSLLDELPARVANGEVSGGEAVLLQQSLFDTLGSEASVRVQQRLALRDATPVPPDVQAQLAQDARYKREEAAVLADWNNRPANQRDPAALESALETLRQTVFSHSDPGGSATSTSPGDTR